ncbi:MAG: hypothetical protein WCN98_17980, partial [Verrucomicrobiaceae bacterium]
PAQGSSFHPSGFHSGFHFQILPNEVSMIPESHGIERVDVSALTAFSGKHRGRSDPSPRQRLQLPRR